MLSKWTFRTAIVATIVSIGAVWSIGVAAQRIVEGLPSNLRDLATAQTVEVKDGSDQVLLKGTFVTSTESSKEIEKIATLNAMTGSSANGKAEIEIERSASTVTNQELEVTLKRLPAETAVKLFVDGEQIKSFVTNRKGDADLKFTSKQGK